MAKKKKKGKDKGVPRNAVAVAMRRRYGATVSVHADRRERRRGRRSWRKDEARDWG